VQCAALQIRADEEVAKMIRHHFDGTLDSVHAHQTKVSVPASTGWPRSVVIGMRLVHEAPENRELGA
jgi:hypothetical protein